MKDPGFVEHIEGIEMTFVNERIPETEKSNFKFEVKTSPDGSKPTLSWWAIDRERDAYVVLVNYYGGPYEGTPRTQYYVLAWKNELIGIEACPQPKTFTENGAVMSWEIHKLRLPSSLQGERGAVFSLIRDAFIAMGEYFDGDRFAFVNVEFDCSIPR